MLTPADILKLMPHPELVARLEKTIDGALTQSAVTGNWPCRVVVTVDLQPFAANAVLEYEHVGWDVSVLETCPVVLVFNRPSSGNPL